MSGQERKSEKNRVTPGTVLAAAGILILAAMEWFCHRRVPFMMDDLWYSTNLATDEALRGLPDIVESQIWHFLNWGGRCVTHGILQMTLMSGEFAADILNMAAVLLLGWMICVTAEWKKPFCFLAASSMIVAMNANVRMSMFWQAGTVNYVYSSVWILAFLQPYLRQAEDPDAHSLPFVNFWIFPLGLMAGWSNENMGPACLLVTAAATIYTIKKERKSDGLASGRRKACRRPWMISGVLSCFAGSILVVAAPGNFVRKSIIEDMPLGERLYDRFYSMLRAGTDYLFPAVSLLILLLLIWTVCMGGKLRFAQWMLLALAVLSYGAMVLSPHYPDRAAFGTMTVCIVLSLSLLKDILEKKSSLGIYACLAVFSYWCCAIYALMTI